MLLLLFVVTDGTDAEEKQSPPRVGGSGAGGHPAAAPGMLDDIHINFIKLVSPVIKYYWQCYLGNCAYYLKTCWYRKI